MSKTLLKSFVAYDRKTVDLLATRFAKSPLGEKLRHVSGGIQQLESEIDVLSFEDAAAKEHQAFGALEEVTHGKILSVRVPTYVSKRNKLLKTGDKSVLAFLAVLAENQGRMLEASGRFERFESEIDVLSFVGTVIENYERLLQCVEDIWSLQKAA